MSVNDRDTAKPKAEKPPRPGDAYAAPPATPSKFPVPTTGKPMSAVPPPRK